MISHYLKLAKKHLIKNKFYTSINLFGLVCGMLSAFIIAKYIGGSLQFDSHHVNKNRIYTLTQEESVNGNLSKKSNVTYWGIGELINQYPEVIDITRYNQLVESLVIAEGGKADGVSFIENKIFAADSNFIKIFTFPIIYGKQQSLLSKPKSIVLTKSTSEKYYGKDNPIGKVLKIRVPWGGETMYEVTGVIEDIPQKSQFRFNFLITHPQMNTNQIWDIPNCITYVLLKEKVISNELSNKITNTVNEVAPLKLTNRKVNISLESFANIQLTSTEYLLVAVAIFILIISWVNYINQIIAQSYGRFKGIGILRIMGATRTNLKTQFIVESSLVCVTSLIFVIVIYSSIEPSLQSFTHGHLLPLLGDPTSINFFFLAIFMVGIALGAVIPTVVLFTQNIETTLQNKYSHKIGSSGLRKALVVLQFSISTILMISIFVITNQLEYMDSKDKGISLENTFIVKSPMEIETWGIKRKRLSLFKEKCRELPFVAGIASSTTVPSQEYRDETYLSFLDKNDKSLVYLNRVDDHFLNLYGTKFIAGHNFIPDAIWKNKKSIILNESAASALSIVDYDKMINSKIINHESNEVYNLIGIVKDYHKTSLKYKIKPMAFQFNDSRGHFSLKFNSTALNDNGINEVYSAIKQIWEQVYHDAPFDYYFLDEKYEAQNIEEKYFGKLFKIFTVLSIIISCLGLFGLSLLVSTKRQMEIGVRKVFGASTNDVLAIFLKGHFGSMCLSALIGSPLAYLLMDLWLRNYSYRVEIGVWPISLAVLSLALIFLFTVSYHTIKSSFVNPVTILKD